MSDPAEVRTPARPLSVSVIKAITEHEGVPPDELHPPLFNVIDSEALDCLFAPTPRGEPRTKGCVTFSYKDYQVKVWSDGKVSIQQEQVK